MFSSTLIHRAMITDRKRQWEIRPFSGLTIAGDASLTGAEACP